MDFKIIEFHVAPERIPSGFLGNDEESLVFSGRAIPVDETGTALSADIVPVDLVKPLSQVPEEVLNAIEVITNFIEQESKNASVERFQEFEKIRTSIRPIKKTIDKGKALKKKAPPQ